MKTQVETQVTPFQAVNAFMLFTYNFSQEELNGMFKVTNCPDHLRSKYNNLQGTATERLLKLWGLLSDDNQMKIVDYIIALNRYITK